MVYVNTVGGSPERGLLMLIIQEWMGDSKRSLVPSEN